MNRTEIQKKLGMVTTELIREKGFISTVDVFIRLGLLDQKDVETWRLGRVPYLERVIHANLNKISFIMKTFRQNSLKGGLKPSWTSYRKWGKGAKHDLRFSKSGSPYIEEAYATHFVGGGRKSSAEEKRN